MHHVREGKHGARSTKQAIAIGLSKARRSGVKLRPPRRAKASTKRSAKYASLDFITVSTNAPAVQATALAFLQKHYAGHTNLQWPAADARGVQTAFGATWATTLPLETLFQRAE